MLDPYNEKRVLQIGLLAIGSMAVMGDRKSRGAWMGVYSGLPGIARWGFPAALVGGGVSAAWAPVPWYGLVQVSHFGLLLVLGTSVAAAYRRWPRETELTIVGAVAVGAIVHTTYFAARYVWTVTVEGGSLGRGVVGAFTNVRFFNQYQTWAIPILIGATTWLWQKAFGRKMGVESGEWEYGEVFAWGLIMAAAMSWWTMVYVSEVEGTFHAMWISAVWVGILFRKTSLKWIYTQGGAALGGGVLYYLFFGSAVFGGQSQSGVPNVVEPLGAASHMGRLRHLQLAGEMIQSSPFLGIGPMHFAWPAVHVLRPAHPHNAIAQWAAEWGLPSTLLLGGIAVWGFLRWSHVEKERVSVMAGGSKAIGMSVVAAAIAGAAHAVVSGVIVMPLSQVMMTLVAGWALGRYLTIEKTKPAKHGRWRVWQEAILAVGVLLAVAVTSGEALRTDAGTARTKALWEKTEQDRFPPRYWRQGYIEIKAGPEGKIQNRPFWRSGS